MEVSASVRGKEKLRGVVLQGHSGSIWTFTLVPPLDIILESPNHQKRPDPWPRKTILVHLHPAAPGPAPMGRGAALSSALNSVRLQKFQESENMILDPISSPTLGSGNALLHTTAL